MNLNVIVVIIIVKRILVDSLSNTLTPCGMKSVDSLNCNDSSLLSPTTLFISSDSITPFTVPLATFRLNCHNKHYKAICTTALPSLAVITERRRKMRKEIKTETEHEPFNAKDNPFSLPLDITTVPKFEPTPLTISERELEEELRNSIQTTAKKHRDDEYEDETNEANDDFTEPNASPFTTSDDDLFTATANTTGIMDSTTTLKGINFPTLLPHAPIEPFPINFNPRTTFAPRSPPAAPALPPAPPIIQPPSENTIPHNIAPPGFSPDETNKANDNFTEPSTSPFTTSDDGSFTATANTTGIIDSTTILKGIIFPPLLPQAPIEPFPINFNPRTTFAPRSPPTAPALPPAPPIIQPPSENPIPHNIAPPGFSPEPPGFEPIEIEEEEDNDEKDLLPHVTNSTTVHPSIKCIDSLKHGKNHKKKKVPRKKKKLIVTFSTEDFDDFGEESDNENDNSTEKKNKTLKLKKVKRPSIRTKQPPQSRSKLKNGCSLPEICGQNCGIYIDENGCQGCKCLWISNACKSDVDCHGEGQFCEFNRCECMQGFEYDEHNSGVCRQIDRNQARITKRIENIEQNGIVVSGLINSARALKRLPNERIFFKKNHDFIPFANRRLRREISSTISSIISALPTTNNTAISIWRKIRVRTTSTIPITTTIVTKNLTAINMNIISQTTETPNTVSQTTSVGILGTKSLINISNFIRPDNWMPGKPKREERLQWPGPCERDEDCPVNLYCIESDCWALPEKPIHNNKKLNYESNVTINTIIFKNISAENRVIWKTTLSTNLQKLASTSNHSNPIEYSKNFLKLSSSTLATTNIMKLRPPPIALPPSHAPPIVTTIAPEKIVEEVERKANQLLVKHDKKSQFTTTTEASLTTQKIEVQASSDQYTNLNLKSYDEILKKKVKEDVFDEKKLNKFEPEKITNKFTKKSEENKNIIFNTTINPLNTTHDNEIFVNTELDFNGEHQPIIFTESMKENIFEENDIYKGTIKNELNSGINSNIKQRHRLHHSKIFDDIEDRKNANNMEIIKATNSLSKQIHNKKNHHNEVNIKIDKNESINDHDYASFITKTNSFITRYDIKPEKAQIEKPTESEMFTTASNQLEEKDSLYNSDIRINSAGKRVIYDYSPQNRLLKPVRVQLRHAKSIMRNECNTHVDCGIGGIGAPAEPSKIKDVAHHRRPNRTYGRGTSLLCCEKRWCDLTAECGMARFCLPNCGLTKLTHLGWTGARGMPLLDLIYD